jgi:hypothetical protein
MLVAPSDADAVPVGAPVANTGGNNFSVVKNTLHCLFSEEEEIIDMEWSDKESETDKEFETYSEPRTGNEN